MIGWQRHQLNRMQVICASLQTDNHASTSLLSFLRAGCSSCHPANSVKALYNGCKMVVVVVVRKLVVVVVVVVCKLVHTAC